MLGIIDRIKSYLNLTSIQAKLSWAFGVSAIIALIFVTAAFSLLEYCNRKQQAIEGLSTLATLFLVFSFLSIFIYLTQNQITQLPINRGY